MRSIPAAFLGLTAVSFLTFFVAGQHHPFGSEAASTFSSALAHKTIVSANCTAGASTGCDAVARQPTEEELRAAIGSFAERLRHGALGALTLTFAAVAEALDDAQSGQASSLPVAPAAREAIARIEAVTAAVAVGSAQEPATLPGTTGAGAPPTNQATIAGAPASQPPASPVSQPPASAAGVDPDVAKLRAAIEQQVNATIEQALAHTVAADVRAVAKPSSASPPQTSTSTSGLQADPGCNVQQDKGETWSRSAVQCNQHVVKTDGGSTSSVLTSTSSVSVASTTSNAGVR